MERGAFTSSEDFAKSLEPQFDTRHKPHSTSHHKNHRPHPKQKMQLPRMNMPKFDLPQQKPKPHNPHHHHKRKKFEVFAAVYLFFLLVMVMFLSASTNSGPFIVLMAFLPTLFTVVIAMIIYEAAKDNKNVLWVIPLVLIFAFNWYGRTNGGFVGGVNVEVMTALNILFSFLYLIINYFLLQSATKTTKRVVQQQIVRKEPEPEDITSFISSIEDKGKALNFVIGRVYNAYHGGTKELRQKINMKQEWYDQFSQIPSDPAKVDFVALSSLISTIESRLRLLDKSEVEIFGSEHNNFKNLVRDRDGKDKIIDVLDRNDKDPVTNYVKGSLEFCGKIKDFIKRREAPSVKNEYVARPDADKKSAPRSSWTKNLLKR